MSFEAAMLFPNPVSDRLQLAFNSKIAGEYDLRVNDITGKTLTVSRLNAVVGLNAELVNTINLAPGIYLLEIRSGDSVQALKFVKE